MEMMALMAVGLFRSDDANSSRSFTEKINKVWKKFNNLQYGFEPDKANKEDEENLKFYTEKVKKSKLKLTKAGKDGFKVEGIETIYE